MPNIPDKIRESDAASVFVAFCRLASAVCNMPSMRVPRVRSDTSGSIESRQFPASKAVVMGLVEAIVLAVLDSFCVLVGPALAPKERELTAGNKAACVRFAPCALSVWKHD